MKIRFKVSGINVNNEHHINRILGDYGWHGYFFNDGLTKGTTGLFNMYKLSSHEKADLMEIAARLSEYFEVVVCKP